MKKYFLILAAFFCIGINSDALQVQQCTHQIEQTSNRPLIIVDGKETCFENIRPESVASITILKGQSAVEQYGEKGKNGVVIITTRKENVIVNE